MKSEDHSWFALSARIRREKYISNILELKGYEVFLPMYRTKRQWSDRIKEFENPLFPGYVFCRFDPSNKLPILTIPGVLSIVGIGKTPVPVDEVEIDSIRTVIQAELPTNSWPYFEVGQKVRVEVGPLRGLEGIILNSDTSTQLVISVTLLQRGVAVTIDADWVSTTEYARLRSQQNLG